MAWPHPDTDWQALLAQAETCYCEIARAILARQNLLLLCRDDNHETHIRKLLGTIARGNPRLHFRAISYNDTWTRDYGPLTVHDNGRIRLLDFIFNGWGNKFSAARDNAVNSLLDWSTPLHSEPMVLEGGSVEVDGCGHLLTTRHCLLNPNRNPQMNEQQIEAALCQSLGVNDIWWLDHGHLEGDDTDAHIDTLARFCDRKTIAYVQCSDHNDSHYPALSAMEKQLQALAAAHDLTLVPLPLPDAQLDADGERLPATHANFLIINQAVLVPTYNDPSDELSLQRLAEAFPDREIIGIDCRVLIAQHGSLHCITMQLPEGVSVKTR